MISRIARKQLSSPTSDTPSRKKYDIENDLPVHAIDYNQEAKASIFLDPEFLSTFPDQKVLLKNLIGSSDATLGLEKSSNAVKDQQSPPGKYRFIFKKDALAVTKDQSPNGGDTSTLSSGTTPQESIGPKEPTDPQGSADHREPTDPQGSADPRKATNHLSKEEAGIRYFHFPANNMDVR